MDTITQLPESNIPYAERIDRILEVLTPAGCSTAELLTDWEVALSVKPS